MSDPSDHETQVRRAAILLAKRASGDAHTQVAISRKLKGVPDHVLTEAKSRSKAGNAKGTGHHRAGGASPTDAPASSGGLTFDAEEITVSASELSQFHNSHDVAQQVIGREVDRYIATVQQGHRQGYAHFRSWYREWESAKENSSNEIASKICGYLLEKGLAIIFPEDEVFIIILKEVATKGFDLATQQLNKVETGKLDSFLDAVWAAEERAITALRLTLTTSSSRSTPTTSKR